MAEWLFLSDLGKGEGDLHSRLAGLEGGVSLAVFTMGGPGGGSQGDVVQSQ